MLLSDYYSESIYSENGVNYEILEAGKNQRSRFSVRCVVCLVEATVTAASILSGRKPCLCSVKAHNKPELRKSRLVKILKEKQMLLLTDIVTSAKSKLEVSCLVCGISSKYSYDFLCRKNSGCSDCNGTPKKTELELMTQLLDKTRNKNLIIKSMCYQSGISRDIRVSVECLDCNNTWETSVASITRGSGCPVCAKYGFQTSQPAFLYLLRIILEETQLIGYKYGITLNLEQRIAQHNKECKFLGVEFEPSIIWPYSSGLLAKEHEKAIKKVFPRHFNKYELPSGFTETIPPEVFGQLVDFQTNQYNEVT